MIPGRIPHATRFLGAPSDWDEARDGICSTLPVRDIPGEDGINEMRSSWQPSPEEIALIVAGAPVHLSVFGIGHPPVMLSVGQPPEVSDG